MTESVHRQTAQILEFPAGGRAAAVSTRDGAKPDAARLPIGAGKAVFGNGWYHEAAVQDADQPRKR
jgi:Protein of unknown function (DUF2735)